MHSYVECTSSRGIRKSFVVMQWCFRPCVWAELLLSRSHFWLLQDSCVHRPGTWTEVEAEEQGDWCTEEALVIQSCSPRATAAHWCSLVCLHGRYGADFVGVIYCKKKRSFPVTSVVVWWLLGVLTVLLSPGNTRSCATTACDFTSVPEVSLYPQVWNVQ